MTKPVWISPAPTSFSTLATDQREISFGNMKMRLVTYYNGVVVVDDVVVLVVDDVPHVLIDVVT